MLQLRFADTAEAARTCQAWMQRQPNSWLPHFTYAHVRCRQGQAGAAAAEFEDWVRQHKNFAHCIYLALFEFREGRTNEALQGVRLALEQPFIEPWGTDGNKFYLGQNGALIAYLQGDYGLSLAMCDKMLSDSRPEKWWTREVLRLKAAVVFMKGDQSRALELMQQAEANRERGPFSEEPKARADQALRAALQRKDTAFIQDFRNCVDEHDKWFSPFETDETGIHGGGLQVPSPYPRSWTTDEMNPEKEQ
jgi:tetratricopeptide (TPR) repeat protein